MGVVCGRSLMGVHTVVQRAILHHTFVRVRPSQRRTRTKLRVRVRVRRRQCWIFLYVVHVYDVQMYELALFRWAYFHCWRSKLNAVFTSYTL